MPNQSSHAQHTALRTCIICRQKSSVNTLLGFYLLGKDIVFDINKQVQTRKRYLCHNESCYFKLDKWLSKYVKSKSFTKPDKVK
jgi:predicted RNA-binding protein YlxR (DUF448 family)